MPLRAGLRPVVLWTLFVAAAVTCIISLRAVSKGPDNSAHYDFNGKRTPRVLQKQYVTDLVYFNDPSIQEQLGCAKNIENDELHNYTCFYQMPSKAADQSSDSILLDAGRMCSAVYKPIPADFGRPWCIRQTKFGKTLAAVPKSQRLHLKGTTLLMGRLSGPNPTHQLNIHFYYIYLWMKQKGIKIGDLNLLIDCSEPPEWIGSYGLGLARAFGTFRFLHELPTATTFDEIRFSLPGTFPFDLHFYEVDKGFDCTLFELAWGVKQRVSTDPSQTANLKRVVVAQRRPSESRHMNNVSELVSALKARGFNASAVTFGELSFADQLRTVSDAAVLVGVTGSDLVSLIFLPLNAAIVEVFPVVQGRQVFTPELWHLAQMSGKQHLKYVSPYNSSVLQDEAGRMIGDKPVHQVKATDVHIPSLVALVESAALMVQDSIRTKAVIADDGTCSSRTDEWYVSWLQEHM